ncbi:tRNA (adenosine(37)-N6)-threonylcarbamoyltransferase complex dimerization subunit type 1 TsaB [Nitrosomonas supralitoralis]|uniref:tRNA (Adenosine(37)-N6)-threonylcarbamoyltransferase complex dimerization subunit type 1 TsaB n=1 Tax=Nitrosomonas supralitoralis TaxID=2116706 RepID=A0A2P7NUA3_9PROT|nr:tRNA (adenosine(37)-N6)-threonylcarbamoyltransferase complex dimerization subunit type 1 TsaB [Nitrosomonas supralitoralis]PSJ17052.1 tRNA (adenosine(37)-N6)-threonylcarbamoyltransferase complex dimerization subunit type 1 TsaB [Nitrosomonas supralitoralis]
MKILALETSTEFCSVALLLEEAIIEKEVHAGQRHSEILLLMIQEILVEAKLTLQQIDSIAFGAGPGSFTGLRIACGIAQGLAYAAGISIIRISTLEAVAQKIDKQKVIVALDARMGEIYHAAYQKVTNQGWEIISSPILCLPQQAPVLSDTNWHGSGSGFDVYRKELSLRYRKNLQRIHSDIHPHAKEIAQLALLHSSTDPTNATPIYLRNKVALKENERQL